MSDFRLYQGDCLEKMHDLADGCVDAIVTDPPYGLSFMGKDFDTFHADGKTDNEAFQTAMTPIFMEALRVAKPGAHLLAFGGTRTYHRLACAIEDAGWECRDSIMWHHGSGFPKSMDVSKAIDKMLGVGRDIVGYSSSGVGKPSAMLNHGHDDRTGHANGDGKTFAITAPATPEAAAWSGWGTALKPATEIIMVARKPLEGTVAANVLKYGTGAINIDGCRVPLPEGDNLTDGIKRTEHKMDTQGMGFNFVAKNRPAGIGRFPANLIHDGSDEVLALFPDSKGQCGAVKGTEPSEITNGIYGKYNARLAAEPRGDTGSAARFFYCAKASRAERGEGNDHPTVKPISLMRYLIRLVTRKGGIVLDPFMGSGTTGIAALHEGMKFIGMEKDEHYLEIAKGRIEKEEVHRVQGELF